MKLLKHFLKSELKEMLENGIRLQTIGRTHKLPKDIQKVLSETMSRTASNRDMVLTLALSYGGRQEITDGLQRIAARIEAGKLSARDVTEDLVRDSLYTAAMPDPDLLIRTSGECRVSNFLLWQIAYTEIYMTPTLWPDFRKEEYLKALEEYQRRERRFGATGEQVANGESGPLT
jgi:undecaprenyl diphosphate synthase